MKRRTWMPVAAVALALCVGVLWWVSRATAPRTADWEDVRAEARRGGYRLIDTEGLQRFLDDPSRRVLLVDAREAWEYRAGHIPGSVNFPMEPTWWARWRKARALEKLLGPDRDRTVVFY
ncbi:Rhodanese-like domain-containing protein [Desulfacinum infernum DSM 9756]|uniref:Rhodanese-like domain-containing protein n=2 Tax=Desulfacinum infernum TaxID=35837 RepID=A0A1M5HV02_9BACT|nr:rhodanese-like domain-containing protein [Desulfacinum infernum]SHG19768.1 Rhodanese-like domain-containing protein [Desulfacinum infernum DSM 9756]